MQTETKRDVYQIVTDRIIAHLENGVVPWKRPWTDNQPRNLISGRPYRGINILLLTPLGYADNSFLTFKQVKEIGATVKKGERAHLVVFWKKDVKEDKEKDEKTTKFLLRYYMVFNVSQCDNIPVKFFQQKELGEIESIPSCENVIWNMPKCPTILHKENQGAYYDPTFDHIVMPEKESFFPQEGYYGTLFHELIHSTGHHSRLYRKELMESTSSDSFAYSIEEMTAEIGASYLKCITGIAHDDYANNASYISGWLARLKKDKRFIVHAASQAQKATDFILNVGEKHSEEMVSHEAKTQ